MEFSLKILFFLENGSLAVKGGGNYASKKPRFACVWLAWSAATKATNLDPDTTVLLPESDSFNLGILEHELHSQLPEFKPAI